MSEYQQFVRQLRQVERLQQRQRVQASGEKRTLELGALGKAISKGQGITLREYGQDVRYTIDQLQRFDSRRRAVERQFQSTGVTASAILAQMRPFPTFSNTVDRRSSDLARARNIPRPDFVSARGNTLNFRVRAENPDPKRGLSHHITSVQLVDFEKALRTPLDTKGSYLPAVEKAISGGVKLNCDCGRWRFWYRYKATVGGYAIKPERGFPKIRNAKLTGTVCKHLLVTLNYLRQSKPLAQNLALRFAKAAGTVVPDKKTESFVTKTEEKDLRKSRVDRKLRKVSKAKETFQQERKAKQTEQERLRRIARQVARKQERTQKRKSREAEEAERAKAQYNQLQASNRAMQRQLKREQRQREALEKQLTQQQENMDKTIAIQIVKAMRSAGLDDKTIALNPVVKQAKIKPEEVE